MSDAEDVEASVHSSVVDGAEAEIDAVVDENAVEAVPATDGQEEREEGTAEEHVAEEHVAEEHVAEEHVAEEHVAEEYVADDASAADGAGSVVGDVEVKSSEARYEEAEIHVDAGNDTEQRGVIVDEGGEENGGRGGEETGEDGGNAGSPSERNNEEGGDEVSDGRERGETGGDGEEKAEPVVNDVMISESDYLKVPEHVEEDDSSRQSIQTLVFHTHEYSSDGLNSKRVNDSELGNVAEKETEDVLKSKSKLRRNELIKAYRQALEDREQLTHKNNFLQNKLADYFTRKQAHNRRDRDSDNNSTSDYDLEQKYRKSIAQYQGILKKAADKKEDHRAHIIETKAKLYWKDHALEQKTSRIRDVMLQTAVKSISRLSDKPMPEDVWRKYMTTLGEKDEDVTYGRIKNIKLKKAVSKLEHEAQRTEGLPDGLQPIDFRHLQVENDSFDEKVEEKNELLRKLRKKIESTVQILTHMREKTVYVNEENEGQREILKESDASCAQSRDILCRTKQARKALVEDNHKLRQRCGLLGNKPLLRDFEVRKDEVEELRLKLDKLKMKHAELTLQCDQYKRKIKQRMDDKASV